MPLYEYNAKTLQGALVKGTMEAVDEKSLIEILRGKNYYPVNIRLESKTNNIDFAQFSKLSLKDIAVFCRQFSFINAAGISILRALEITKKQTENKKLKLILDSAFEDVQKGKSLSDALGASNELPTMLVNMVKVGEASGTLDKIMERMAFFYDKEYKQRQKIKGAMTYPIVVSIFAVVVILVLVVKVLPVFIDMIKQNGGGELPLPTKIVMAFSNFLITKWWIILIIVLGLIIYIKMPKKNKENLNILDNLKLKAPIFGQLNTKIITAQFARTFSTLMSSGLPLMQSMEICSSVIDNSIIKNIILNSRDEIKKGKGIGETLEKDGIFPIMLTQMIKIGEESGTLDEVLEKTAEFYDAEVETATSQLTTMLEPLIIVVLAFFVGFILLSIFMPMFQSYNAISNEGMFLNMFFNI